MSTITLNKNYRQNDFLILVDEEDKPWGKLEKKLVHELGLLHRAFSVFIFNSDGELLLQQRADGKYHSSGLWTNTCCSHPRFGEDISDAVKRRLNEEMGISCETEPVFNFIYKASFKNGLTEHELDHVYFGVSDMVPNPDSDEVKDWKYVSLENIKSDLIANPDRYTYWFAIIFERVMERHNILQLA